MLAANPRASDNKITVIHIWQAPGRVQRWRLPEDPRHAEVILSTFKPVLGHTLPLTESQSPSTDSEMGGLLVLHWKRSQPSHLQVTENADHGCAISYHIDSPNLVSTVELGGAYVLRRVLRPPANTREYFFGGILRF